ncbi:MAG: ROK family protein [Candidatus Sumerlaeaceae bacterium]|nr:ROK family protein [Candidatus Sumerlaeaceae bacterium]
MAKAKLCLGIDLGGTDCKFGLVDEAGTIVRQIKHPTNLSGGPDGTLDSIAAQAKDLIGSDSVVSIGMGVPGPMSSREGVVYEAPNLKGWVNVPVKKLLEEKLGIPVALSNDANAAAWGEYWVGAGRDVQSMILFTLGTGVGGGIVLNGELYCGPDDTAGELGHMIINFDGPVCGCGSRGCLEAYASATAMRRAVVAGIAAGIKTRINIPQGEETTFGTRAIYDAAEQGDVFAVEVFRQAGFALGIGAANVINIFNPEMICYGGAVTNAGEWIFGPLRATASANAFNKPASRAKIVRAALGNDAGLIGAAGLALRDKTLS